MEIKRIANLSDEEIEKLVTAGELLGSLNKSFEASEFDELSSGAVELIEAINNVSKKLLNK